MNKVAILSNDKTFIELMAEFVVGTNLFESDFGNEFNSGIRFASKWLFDQVMLNDDISDKVKEDFTVSCAQMYILNKSKNDNKGVELCR